MLSRVSVVMHCKGVQQWNIRSYFSLFSCFIVNFGNLLRIASIYNNIYTTYTKPKDNIKKTHTGHIYK